MSIPSFGVALILFVSLGFFASQSDAQDKVVQQYNRAIHSEFNSLVNKIGETRIRLRESQAQPNRTSSDVAIMIFPSIQRQVDSVQKSIQTVEHAQPTTRVSVAANWVRVTNGRTTGHNSGSPPNSAFVSLSTHDRTPSIRRGLRKIE